MASIILFVVSWARGGASGAGHAHPRCVPQLAVKAQALADQLADIERRAMSASEAWDAVATDFLAPDLADAVTQRLGLLSNVGAVRVGGYPGGRRALFVLTHPDLVDSVVPSEHATLFRVHADLGRSPPLPNVLVNVGVQLASVGDVLVEDSDTAFIVVAAGSAKVVKRLLPKGLLAPGGGAVTIDEVVDGGAGIRGEPVEVEVQRVDTRAQNR
ncbi:hypothetical protein KFE25_010317 [Diacronema lutheri]|uniref:Uncharacterized protein n=1 Tax=Diacronema lutheri TaxID=2081491 RepID=A0A8J5XET2_DIALT|nr:hypothetical protein KFE25_010317 [Diacronema lutheri]